MQHQLNTNALPIKIFDTLEFSKNLIKAGMEKTISEELATNIKNLQIIFCDKIEINKIEITNISKDVMALRSEMIIFKIDLGKEMQDFKDEIRKEMQDFKNEIRKEMEGFKKEMRKEMEDFKKEIRKEMEDFKKEIRKEMQDFKDSIDLKISKMVTKEEFYNEMQKLSLNMTIRMGFIMSAGIGIIGLLIKF